MKSKIRRKRNQMRVYPHDKIRGRLLRKGWYMETVDGTMRVGEDDIPVQTEVYTHEKLGEKLTLQLANIAQNRHEQYLKDTFDDRIEEYLLEKGWTLTENGSWYRPNWSPEHEVKQAERLEGTGVNPGYYATLRQAYRLQLKLDSAPEVEGLEESLEDLMLMSHSNEFGA